MLKAECLHIGIGVCNRKYDDPLKYASRYSVVTDCTDDVGTITEIKQFSQQTFYFWRFILRLNIFRMINNTNFVHIEMRPPMWHTHDSTENSFYITFFQKKYFFQKSKKAKIYQ